MLYNHYFFKSLDDVIGHDSVKKDFTKRFKEKNYSGVTLFSGESGSGKTNFIKLYAKTILCESKDSRGYACNVCESCISLDSDNPVGNYKEYNCAQLGIKEVEQIIDSANTKILSKVQKKIIVLDELQQLKSNEAQKALLKILEKQNKNVYWFLGTMDISKIDISLIRRTAFYKLNKIPFDVIMPYLVDVVKKEGVLDVESNEDKLKTLITISENCNGSIGVALMFLERCLNSEIWNEQELIKELEIYSDSSVTNIINYLTAGDVSVFSYELNENIIQSIFNKILLCYKFSSGVAIENYEKRQIVDVKRVEDKILKIIIEELNNLLTKYYVSKPMIQYSFLNMIMNVKEEIGRQSLTERKPRQPRT